MSVIRPPVRPNRVEPVLLERLRERFHDVEFGTVRKRDDPPRECRRSAFFILLILIPS